MSPDVDRIFLAKDLMGPLVRELREKRLGLSQEALGVALGYSEASAQGTVGQIEAGTRAMPDGKLLRLSKMAGVPISYFMVEGVGDAGFREGFNSCLDQLQGVITTMRTQPVIASGSPPSGAAARAARAAQKAERRVRRGNDR